MIGSILTGRIALLCRVSAPYHGALRKPVTSNWKAAKLPWLILRTVSGNTRTSRTTLKQLKEQVANKSKTISVKNRSRFSRIVDGLMAGISLVGMGLLAYMNIFGHVPKHIHWSEIAKQRLRDTYLYFGGGMVFTATSALTIARSPALQKLFGGAGWMSLLATVAMAFTSGYVCHNLPYHEGFGCKQLVWMLHNIILGTLIAPLSVLGGPVMLQVACCGTGIVWGLAAQVVCTPGDSVLFIFAPLAMILNTVFISSVGGWFLPPSPYKGVRLAMVSTAVLASLVFFSGFLFFETSKIVRKAHVHPVNEVDLYDPINNSIRIYISALYVMFNIAMILLQEDKRWK